MQQLLILKKSANHVVLKARQRVCLAYISCDTVPQFRRRWYNLSQAGWVQPAQQAFPREFVEKVGTRGEGEREGNEENKFPQSLGTSLNRGSIAYYFRTLLLGFTVRNVNFSRLYLSHNSQRRLERQENQTKYQKKKKNDQGSI